MTLTAHPLDHARVFGDPPVPAGPHRGRAARLVRGRPQDPAWARPALLALLAGTALLYLWNLSASGTANDFYAAAVQAGTKSWKAFFFGSLDSSNFITVDKPPASLWIMELSGRIFGFNSWSLLAPQALEGVAAVGLTFATVRRWANPGAGLFAGAALALTPAATLIFRFDNPDALLTLLLVAATYATTRALEHGSTRWLVLAGAAIGFAFITKMGQALLIVPALGLAYLIAAPVSLGKRLWQLAASVGALIVGAGWWILAVALTPAADRPYIGGSGDNTVLGLAFGYNGLDRLFGGSGTSGSGATHTSTAATAASTATKAVTGGTGGGGNQGSSFGGSTGLGRLFRGEMGQEISWLLPAALIAIAMGFWLTRRAPRTDRTRAALIMWGGGLLTTFAVFSFMKGTIHPYYTVVLAPPIAVVLAITGHQLWLRRSDFAARAGAALLVVVTAFWSFVLLRRADWLPELRYALLVGAVVAVIALLGLPAKRHLVAGALTVALLTTVGGTAAYAVATASQPHTGSVPSTGPASAASIGGGKGGGIGGSSTRPTGGGTGTTAPSGTPPTGTRPTGTSSFGESATGGSTSSSGFPGGAADSGAGGGATTTSSALTALLKAAGTKWSAAVDGSSSAASLELSSDTAVMAIGGFTGSDNAPTLAQFEAYVAAGDVHYYIVSGGGMGSTSSSSAITTLVEAHFTDSTVGGSTVYNLLSAKS